MKTLIAIWLIVCVVTIYRYEPKHECQFWRDVPYANGFTLEANKEYRLIAEKKTSDFVYEVNKVLVCDENGNLWEVRRFIPEEDVVLNKFN